MNISETNRPIGIKISSGASFGWGKYVLKRVSFGSKDCTKELKLECAPGYTKAAKGFGPDWIRALVYMAIDRSHRVIMRKIL